MIWVGVGMLLFGAYSSGTLLLVNNYVGPASHDADHWHFWFIEVFVHLVLLAAMLSAVPAMHRLDRRFAYAFPLLVLGVTLLLRMPDLGDWYNLRFRTHGVAWFFVLGWLVQRSRTWAQRASTSAIVVASVVGYFHVAPREWRIVALLLVLVWARDLPVPRWIVRPVGTLAAASMWIYVSHFAIWPMFRSVFVREVAYVCTIAAGVGVWWAAERLLGLLNTWRQVLETRRPGGSRRLVIPRPLVRGIS
jgi:surface polysaccharide O-acyltransferase-like enzyme